MSKLVEWVIQIRLEDHFAENNLLAAKNYAYRKVHSAELLLPKVVNNLYASFDKYALSCGLFITDYSV